MEASPSQPARTKITIYEAPEQSGTVISLDGVDGCRFGLLLDVRRREQLFRPGAHLVSTSAAVKPGAIVVIQAAKAGGLVTMLLDSDLFERALYHDAADRYLDQQATDFAEWFKNVDVRPTWDGNTRHTK